MAAPSPPALATAVAGECPSSAVGVMASARPLDGTRCAAGGGMTTEDAANAGWLPRPLVARGRAHRRRRTRWDRDASPRWIEGDPRGRSGSSGERGADATATVASSAHVGQRLRVLATAANTAAVDRHLPCPLTPPLRRPNAATRPTSTPAAAAILLLSSTKWTQWRRVTDAGGVWSCSPRTPVGRRHHPWCGPRRPTEGCAAPPCGTVSWVGTRERVGRHGGWPLDHPSTPALVE